MISRLFFIVFTLVACFSGCRTEPTNQWAGEISARIRELRKQGVPTNLEELCATIKPTSAELLAGEYFNKAFGFKTKGPLPTIPQNPDHKEFKSILSPDEYAKIQQYVKLNSKELELLHRGLQYNKVYFPVDLENGFATKLPHLGKFKCACQLLILEAIVFAYEKNNNGAYQSLHDCVHLAGLLASSRSGVEYVIEIWPINKASYALNLCLEFCAFSPAQLESLMDDFRNSYNANRLKQLLVSERCMALSVFLGGDEKIMDFFETVEGKREPKEKQELRLGILFRINNGLWDRDCANYIRTIDRLEQIQKSPASVRWSMLDAIKTEIEESRKFRTGQEIEVNIISAMLLPPIAQCVEKSLVLQATLDVTAATLGVELYHARHGRWPKDWRELSPQILPDIPKNRFTGQPLVYQQSENGYIVHDFGPNQKDDSGKAKEPNDDIIFSVRR